MLGSFLALFGIFIIYWYFLKGSKLEYMPWLWVLGLGSFLALFGVCVNFKGEWKGSNAISRGWHFGIFFWHVLVFVWILRENGKKVMPLVGGGILGSFLALFGIRLDFGWIFRGNGREEIPIVGDSILGFFFGE